ncbi:hypothetical protein EG328_006206 [Venturia inaequalis]|uniref:GH16 domain-containing protein n=1 Tax=Venturia inaequalis TaxID=5025 RepID=A0A8H3YSM6_VENIN|nr:hypothetical protein EG328_006206 [Venturia inaequalis]
MTKLVNLFHLVLASTYSLASAWTLTDTYNASNWDHGMWVETRVTNGEYVRYLSKDQALSSGLLRTQNNQIYMGVDTTRGLDWASGIGRDSVRLRTNKAFNAGTLVIGDFAHMPSNTCGIWPSFWMVGTEWPRDGEIDIMEGVNQMSQNQITIHTKPGCVPRVGDGGQSGTITGFADCGGNNGDIGCGVFNTKQEGWGNGFNNAGGGLYAMLWTRDAIKVWSWTHGQAPRDAQVGGAVNPDAWGQPVANWAGCDFADFFRDLTIIINTSFCGAWAGAVWKDGSCKALANECYHIDISKAKSSKGGRAVRTGT